MTLNDCTKEELIFIIKRLTRSDKYYLQRALGDLEYERVKKKLTEAEHWGQVADSCRQRYIELLRKYEGKKLTDIPISDIKEMQECLKNAEKADKKFEALMKEVDEYGNRN